MLAAVLLAAAAQAARAEDASLNILALGDSTTAGTPGFRSPAEWPPDGMGDPESQYVHWMRKRHPEWRVRNEGVNAERTDQILSRFRKIVKNDSYDFVIVLAGVNDIFQGFPPGRAEENLSRIYDLAVQYRMKVVACTILPYDDATPKAVVNIRKVNEWIKETARERGFILCDTHEALEDPKNPGKLRATPDGLHPDVAGYRKMGEEIAAAIEKSG